MGTFSRRNFIQRTAACAAGIAAGAATGDLPAQGISLPTASAEAQSPAESPQIHLNSKEYFSAPGFSFLVFHNNYQVGFQGGLQMIQNGERILDSGDFYFVPREGGRDGRKVVLRRVVDREHATATVEGEIQDWKQKYSLICATDGKSITVTLKAPPTIPWEQIREAGFRIYIYPGDYFGKSYQGDHGSGTFSRQYAGRRTLMEGTSNLLVAAEDPAHSFCITRTGGTLRLGDNRWPSPDHWLSVEAPLPRDSTRNEVHVEITPSMLPGWRKTPVIGISQIGYHPAQPKRAVIELDSRDNPRGEARLYRLESNGSFDLVKKGKCASWGKFLRYQYTVFDFTEVRQPGMYKLKYGEQEAGLFPIQSTVYGTAWEPTLEYFLPIQMCHVKVHEGERMWHGACHLDDALQAPAHKVNMDGYQQDDIEDQYKANEHIPGLNWGGWHDAEDHDLPAGSFVMTVVPLVMAEEEFHPKIDRLSINRGTRLVSLHVPDGKPDVLQQIQYGAESLLASYRVAGHIFSGIIASSDFIYNVMGDSVNATDNLVYDASLRPNQIEGDRSGNFDDRWAFTNRNTGLQYSVAQTLAMASRVLRGFNDDLATECLKTARELWEYEQTHPSVYWQCGYNPQDSGFRSQEIDATAELFLTTKEENYHKHLLELLPVWKGISGEQFAHGPGWTLARAMSAMNDGHFESAVHHLAEKWKTEADRRAATNPYGVRYPDSISNPSWKLETRTGVHSGFVWGYGWDLQDDAFRQYYFHKYFPQLFGADPLFTVLNFVLGCHPATNESFVSGVGVNSAPVANGFNCADWSYIPGGIFSGCSLIKPDFMELKVFPFLWYQREYVISGAATYIFLTLAANKLLNS